MQRCAGADDVLGKLREAFPAGLATSRPEFEKSLAAVEQPSFASMGNSMMRADLDENQPVEVKMANLASAHASIKVRMQLTTSWACSSSYPCVSS